MLTKEYARLHKDMSKKFVEENYYISYLNDFIKDYQDYMLMRLNALQVMSCGEKVVLYYHDNINTHISDGIVSYLSYGWNEEAIYNSIASYNDYIRYNLFINSCSKLLFEGDGYEKKLLSKTYLRDAKEYKLKIDFSNDDYWYSVKYFIDTEPFVLNNGLKVIDNGYYILELLPKNENYSMRVYFNEKKEILEYYFDISLSNGIDSETKIPYYDDAFIDITLTDDVIEILDEDELELAHQEGRISDNELEIIRNATTKLYDEISNRTNKYINMNLSELL